jgi:dGTP triphosphohydrolase
MISVLKDILAYLVEAADDICYTIIDFEDGINLGLVSEDFFWVLIKLVKDSIDTSKYKKRLQPRKTALVICVLWQSVV